MQIEFKPGDPQLLKSLARFIEQANAKKGIKDHTVSDSLERMAKRIELYLLKDFDTRKKV